MTAVADLIGIGEVALQEGRWEDARQACEAAIAESDSAAARFGLATALWWLGDNSASVEHCTAAYALFRAAGDVTEAVECALWLAVTYKANFANFTAANGWIARAERLLEPIEPSPAHGWTWVTRAYRMVDLDAAEALTQQALDLARRTGDVDLELAASSQLGLIRVGQGDVSAGFALIDEAMAAALGGEPSSLGTVVYTACDMLNACELASDAERAAQWCDVADRFVERYGCPFLYAECRIFYGSVLMATGKWHDAERELNVGVRLTAGTCPGLHRRALTRLATLHIRQGRLEEAEQLIGQFGGGADVDSDATLAVAALLLARGDGAGASRQLERRWRSIERHRMHLVAALDLLVDAQLAAEAIDAAAAAVTHLADVAETGGDRLGAIVLAARGRVAAAGGDRASAVELLEDAALQFAQINAPFEAARVHLQLAGILADDQPDVAIDHAGSALASFEVLGARLDADRASAVLRHLGVVTRSGPRGIGRLTAREHEVLVLLGHGLSNPEIAARLFISRKTVAHHVSRILTKLDLRNRAAAASYATSAHLINERSDR